MVDLSVEYAGITFRNPLIAASATPTRDAKSMKKAVDAGFGGVVAKSLFGDAAAIGRRYPRPRFKLLGWKEYPGYPEKKTRYFTLRSLEDSSKFGYEGYAGDINKAKRLIEENGVVIASVSASSPAEWEELLTVVNGTEADMCELNVSCPFAADTGLKMGAGAVDIAPEIVKIAKKNLSIPISAKLSPQVFDMTTIAKAAEAAGADALTVQARLSGLMIDIETAKPTDWGSIGGYGGPYLIGYGLNGVSNVAQEVNIPISAVLGVWSWDDIIRYIMVGATTVQSATAVILRGYGVARRWLRNITAWMEKKGYESICEFQGAALKNIISTKDVVREPEGLHLEVDVDACIGCGECQMSCFYDAIKLKNGNAQLDQDKCAVCGMCLEKCPTDAISLVKE
ncbi:MAG: 4Fe-4S binding protein [Candidatus Bathyarchaeota archaeon]|nr:4Fe-4S binding protein [Candidatus Bathyarchaeota archaeon]